MIGVYFSGTGNTKYCVKNFLEEYSGKAEMYSIEDRNCLKQIEKNDEIVFAYPIQYSNLPKIVKDFIVSNSSVWQNKKIFIIATMGLFSGDGAGVSGRIFKKYKADVIGGLHLKMPDCVDDVKALKRSLEKNKKIVVESREKAKKAARALKKHKPTKEGLGFFYHMTGLFCQRLYFYNKTKNYSSSLKIDKNKCIGCGKCASICPMNNMEIKNQKAQASDMCTMCYRCISNCPKKAITLLGREVIEQSKIEKYL